MLRLDVVGCRAKARHLAVNRSCTARRSRFGRGSFRPRSEP